MPCVGMSGPEHIVVSVGHPSVITTSFGAIIIPGGVWTVNC